MDVVQEKENKSVDVDWLQLPEHLTTLILSKLSSIFDYARFGLVCLQWRSIFLQQYYCAKSLPPQPPLLVIPTPPEMMIKKKKKNKKKKNETSSTISCSFYRVTDGKIFNRLQLTVPHERQFRGCGFGWLITVDHELCYSVQLLNPFFYPNTATKEIKLPALTTHPTEISDPAYINYTHLRNPVLSADPASNPNDCVVMAIFGGYNRLSFCRPGDKAWTPMIIDSSVVQETFDLIWYQGNFYALDYTGVVLVCDVATRTTTTFAEPPIPSIMSSKMYLVISEGGELFQIHRFYNGGKYSSFIVLKFQRRSETDTDWVVVKDLNGRAFFIGDSPSMSISPSDFPGCKPNCIYYTDDADERHCSAYDGEREDGPHDLGVYNVENKSIEKHYVSDVALWPAPIWIQPVLMPTRSKKKHYC